jgi:hypothetical protein
MTVNIDKMKVMMIESKTITYANFVYDNNILEEVKSYKYLRFNLYCKINWNYSIDKRINGWWEVYYGLENSCKLTNLGI